MVRRWDMQSCSAQLSCMMGPRSRASLSGDQLRKIDRKVASTLVAEASSASQAYDRGTYARVLLYELKRGRDKHWKEMCKEILFGNRLQISL